jgi:hypothetical protein
MSIFQRGHYYERLIIMIQNSCEDSDLHSIWKHPLQKFLGIISVEIND